MPRAGFDVALHRLGSEADCRVTASDPPCGPGHPRTPSDTRSRHRHGAPRLTDRWEGLRTSASPRRVLVFGSSVCSPA